MMNSKRTAVDALIALCLADEDVACVVDDAAVEVFVCAEVAVEVDDELDDGVSNITFSFVVNFVEDEAVDETVVVVVVLVVDVEAVDVCVHWDVPAAEQ
jgi:hypothetical protein